MVIAAIAYRSLPQALQEEYTELLKSHPDYEQWLYAYEKQTVDLPLGEYLFMQASFWPDVIRRQGNEHDFPTWHYTNFPLTPAVLIGQETAIQETITPENDVINGFQKSMDLLFDSTQSAEIRAVYLSWIIHLVGDAHQPLHCVALVNEIYPEGDRGGNSFFVRPTKQSEGMNLHSFWDGLLGRSGDIRNARNEATRLLITGFEGYNESEGVNIRTWVLEGRLLAITYVYLNGALPPTVYEDREAAALLPGDYASNAKSIAEERAVLAGYRLSNVLSGKN